MKSKAAQEVMVAAEEIDVHRDTDQVDHRPALDIVAGHPLDHDWLRALSHARYILVPLLVFSALLNLAVYLTYVVGVFGHNDFRLYYAGAEVGLRYGWAHIYDVQLHQAAVAALRPVGPWYALLTPAPITWVVAPLTLIGYPAAYWAWVALSLALLGAAALYARPRQHQATVYFIWWAALSPLWFSAYEGQVTILAAAAVLAGWRLLETRREFLSGAIFAVAFFKPHLILLLPLALLVSGRWRALLSFSIVALVVGIGMLLTLHPDGIQSYLATLIAPQPAGDTAKTLRSALGGSPAVFVIQAVVVIGVIAVAVNARRTRVVWPAIVAAILGSFLLATYWHPQDYLVLDAAAAIVLAAAPFRVGILVATAVALVSAPVSPLSGHQMTGAWLLFAMGLLVLLAVRTRTRRTVPRLAVLDA
ncbi:MAG TPA: glycosyltransferase family 87 protein [Candidatus Dormibacteraeota bacterium]|nr:glycosyltransferase family 87 protein [Candidatus Dormibacteraeota bacterium]